METFYFDHLPNDTIAVIFSKLDTTDTRDNFIRSFNSEELFTRSDIWKTIYHTSFPGIDLSLVVSIRYNVGYVYHLILYQNINSLYTGILHDLEYMKDSTFQSLYRYKVTSGMMNQIACRYHTELFTQVPTLKSFLSYSNHNYILKLQITASKYFLYIRNNYITGEFKKESSRDEIITLLMYFRFNDFTFCSN